MNHAPRSSGSSTIYEINFMSHYIAKDFNFQPLCYAKDEGLPLLLYFHMNKRVFDSNFKKCF